MRQLQQLLRDPKRLFPIVIGSFAGFLVLASLLFPQSAGIERSSSEILRWVAVVAAFALLVGVINVIGQHLGRLRSGDKRWPYSVVLLIGFILPPGIALYGYFAENATDVATVGLFQDVVQWVYTPLSISLLALLTFFAVNAAIRALGSGNREAVVVVVVAALVLFAQIPALIGVPFLGDTMAWVQNYFALAGLRGLAFGAAIGAIVASVRILLGLDHPYLDR